MSLSSKIVHQPLDTPDIETCRKIYSVEFVNPSIKQLEEFNGLCSKLALEQQRILTRYSGNLKPAKPAVTYDPSAFLVKSLTKPQVLAINEREAPMVASQCVAKQAQLINVPIKESGERLVHIPTYFNKLHISASFSEIPYPEISGIWANKPQEFWTRESFAKRLGIMGQILNTVNVQLHFIEAFRPVGVQEGMYRRRVNRTRCEHPHWDENQIINEARSKTAYTPRLASHKGGAAADIVLQDVESGKLLDFGHEYPDGGVLVLPRTPFVTAGQWRNRQLLQICAGLSGLTLYFGEDWHVSFGDNLASLDENGVADPNYIACYGPIKDFNHQTGEVIDVYESEELDKFFDT